MGTAGFILVEIVVAACLVGICLAGIWGLMHWIMYATGFTYNQAQATELAKDKMECLFSISYDDLSSGSDVIENFSRSWTVSSTDSNNIKEVTVEVQWLDPRGRTNVITLDSIIANGTPPGAGMGLYDLFAGEQ